jgi:hypothetical protein
MPFLVDPASGDIIETDDPRWYFQNGFRSATADELDHWARREEFGGFEQQAQAQAERVVRGATLGAVEGFGDDPEAIRARAEVSEELSPVTSALASIAPDIGVAALTGGIGGLASGAGRLAARSALAEGAGLVRAGLAAGRAGGVAALAGESLGTAAVGAGQAAYAEGRELGDDPGRDAENALIWGGLNFGLGAAMGQLGRGTKGAARETKGAAAETFEASAETIDDIAQAAEHRAAADAAGEVADVAEQAPRAVPLEDVELPGADGMLERVAPDDPRLAELAPEIRDFSERGVAGMSLEDLRALPIDEGPGAAASAAKVKAFAEDEGFIRDGVLPSNNDRGRGGLPAISLFPDEPPALSNGRHRLTAAQQSGQEFMVANVKSYDAEGNTLWDYVGPVRVNPPKVPAAAVRQGEREAVEGGVERALHRASKADADDIVEQALGKAPEREADSFSRQRRLYINRAAILDVAEREMSKDVGGLMKDVGQVARAEKLASVASEVSENLPAQRAVANGIAQDAAKFAGELRAEARAYAGASGKQGMQYAIPGQKSWTLALMDHAKEIKKATSSKALFEALDGFKRTAQEYKLNLETGALNSANPIHHQKLIPRIDSFASSIRKALEDSGTWGKAGEMQRSYNAVIHDKLMPSMRIFEEAVLQRTHRGYDGVWNLEGWETKARALLKNADPGNRRHVASVLDGMDELASVRRQYGDPKMAERIEAQTAKVRRTLGLADEVHDASERMQALGEIVSGVPMGGAIAGGIAGGLPGAAIGAALPGAVRGFVMGDLISAFQRLSGATDQAAQRGVDDWIRSSRVRGAGLRGRLPKLPELSGEAKQLRDVAARRGISQGMALFLGDDESPGAAFERWRDALLDQEKFFTELGHDYGTLQQEAPEVFMALAARADVARRFLIERMPPNVAVSMANPDGYPPSRDAIEDWSEYVNAVRFPTRVVQDLAGISVQEAETIRTVHPRLYELTQQRVIEGIARAQQAGEQLDDSFLQRIGILFPELDGVGSPVFSREFGEAVLAHNQLQREMRAATAGARGGRRQQQPNPLQATIQGGATFGQGF